MKLFVAYTGTVLLNILNLRANLLYDGIADLYIVDIPQMPKNIIDLAKNSNYFRKVVLFKPFDAYIDNKWQNYPFIIKRIFFYMESLFKTKYYQKQIFDNSENQIYDEIITHGLWLDSVFIVRSCYLKNQSIEISLIEEGISALYKDFEWFTNQLIVFEYSTISSIRWKIRWLLETSHTFNNDLSTYQKLIKKFYLYTPSISNICREGKLIGCKLPLFDKYNKLSLKLIQFGSSIDVSELAKRKIILFSYTEGLINDPAHSCFINIILPYLLKKWKPTDIAIKAHPAISLDESYYQNKYPGIFIDNRKYQLESTFTCLNLDNKILITRTSTSVLSPKFKFNFEPYVIFTEFLFSNNFRVRDDLTSIVSNLKAAYHKTDRVMLPKTFEEYSKCLQFI